jgi:hypothetical protein
MRPLLKHESVGLKRRTSLFLLPALRGEKARMRGSIHANGKSWTRGESPHPRLRRDLSPQERGEVEKKKAKSG